MANENETIITLENLIRFKQDFEQHIGAQFAPVYKEFTGDSQEEIGKIYHDRPLCLGLPNDNDHIYFFKTDVTGDVLRYQTVYELDGRNMIVYITITYNQENDTYDVDEGMIPLGGDSSGSDLTIVTNLHDMANIITAYANDDTANFKENHKYGFSGSNSDFMALFEDVLNITATRRLMMGRHDGNRLIMFNGESLKLDAPAEDTNRLHNADNTFALTIVSGESDDQLTFTMTDYYGYLEIIFFHFEGE